MYTKDIEDALNDAILELYKAQTKLNHALYTWLFYDFPVGKPTISIVG